MTWRPRMVPLSPCLLPRAVSLLPQAVLCVPKAISHMFLFFTAGPPLLVKVACSHLSKSFFRESKWATQKPEDHSGVVCHSHTWTRDAWSCQVLCRGNGKHVDLSLAYLTPGPFGSWVCPEHSENDTTDKVHWEIPGLGSEFQLLQHLGWETHF